MKMHFLFLCRAFLAVIGVVLGITEARALALVPIAQDFAPSGRQALQTFRLDNDTDRQVAVTITAVTREMDLDGTETNAPTKDFVVFPTQVVIPARQTQVIRVQWRGTSTPERELAYRIIAEQQAIRSELGPNARAIQLVVRYVGSMYVLPAGARPTVRLESARAIADPRGQKALELTFENSGRAHTLLDLPELTLSAGGVTRTYKEADLDPILGENVLALSRRRFVMPWPPDLPFEQPQAQFKYSPLR